MSKFFKVLKVEIDKQSAQIILNSLYTIILGFTFNEIFLKHQISDTTFNITSLKLYVIILTMYYFFDWFSYNAIKLSLDKTFENIEVLLSAIFILWLGFLLTQSINLKSPNELGTLYYGLLSGIYLLLSSILSGLRLKPKIEENKTTIAEDTFLFIEMLFRIIIGIIFILLFLIKGLIVDSLVIWYLILFSIILVLKIVRYYILLRKMYKQQQLIKTN